jgi:hypothetical protein
MRNRRNKNSNISDIKPIENFLLHLSNSEHKPYLPSGLDYKTAITDYLRAMGEVIKETLMRRWQIDFIRQTLFIMTVNLL